MFILSYIFISNYKLFFFQVANRYLAQLKDEHSDHKFVQDINEKEKEFARIIKTYAA